MSVFQIFNLLLVFFQVCVVFSGFLKQNGASKNKLRLSYDTKQSLT